MKKMLAKTLNRVAVEGTGTPWEEVPFGNGDLPSTVGLPAIRNIVQLMNLPGPQMTQFLVGYGVLQDAVPHLVEARRELLARELGVSEQYAQMLQQQD